MNTKLGTADIAGHKVMDSEGRRIGHAEKVFLDDATGEPEWLYIKSGLLGGKEHFAPLDGASVREGDVFLACAKEKVDTAPDMDADHHMSEQEDLQLRRHYGLSPAPGGDAPGRAPAGRAGMAGGAAGAAGIRDERDIRRGSQRNAAAGEAGQPGRAGVDRDGRREGSLLRSEERLRVATEKVEAGRARLRKYVTTERVSQTVPVTHEEIRVEREPITDRNPADAAAGLAEEEREVILYREEVVVGKDTVPVERVRLRVEEVTEQKTVTEEIRAEHIDYDDGKGRRPRPTS